jgi:guanylate kinase
VTRRSSCPARGPHANDERASRKTPTTSPIAAVRTAPGQRWLLEWTEFLGNYYGTPAPDDYDERDLVLEIEVNGAAQVRAKHPESLLVFVLPPSRAEQRRRLVARGDPPEKVRARLKKAEDEEPVGRAMSDHIVVNDDLDTTVEEIVRIIDKRRQTPH